MSATTSLPDTISLIGMPGAGKSTVGVILAKLTGMRFVDTDLDIQVREDATLQQIIERVATGQQRGQIRTGHGFDPHEVAAWLWASCHGLVSLEMFDIGEEMIRWPTVFAPS